jgi:hypothetical protein
MDTDLFPAPMKEIINHRGRPLFFFFFFLKIHV